MLSKIFSRLYFGALLAASLITTAAAHQDGTPHSHPHLVIGNDLLAGLLVVGIAVLMLCARLLASRRQRQSKTTRPRR